MTAANGTRPAAEYVSCADSLKSLWKQATPCPPNSTDVTLWGLDIPFQYCHSCDGPRQPENELFGLPLTCKDGYFTCNAKRFWVHINGSRRDLSTPSLCCQTGQLCFPSPFLRVLAGAHCLDIPTNTENLTDQTFNHAASIKATIALGTIMGGNFIRRLHANEPGVCFFLAAIAIFRVIKGKSTKVDGDYLEMFSTRSGGVDDLYKSLQEELPIERKLFATGYWSMAACISYSLLLLGCAGIILSLYLMALAQNGGDNSANKYTNSVALISARCNSRSLEYASVASQILHIIIGAFLTGTSNYLQQLCTSPTYPDIKHGISSGKDVQFGSNMPTALLRRRGKLSLLILWGTLALSAFPIHLALSATTGIAYFREAPSVAGVRESDIDHNSTLKIPLRSRYIGTGWTKMPMDVVQSTWEKLTSEQCQEIPNWMGPLGDESPQNILVVLNEDRFNVVRSMWSHVYGPSAGFVDIGLPPFTVGNPPFNIDPEYCYVQSAPSICHFTVRWLPGLIVAIALIFKGISCTIALHFHSHFRQQIFNTVGDIIVLSAKHPELGKASRVGSAPELRIKGPRKIAWHQALTAVDYSVLVLWWACAIRLLSLGWEGSLREDSKFGLHPTMARYSPISFNKTLLLSNIPHVWVCVAYFIWNNQISRLLMEREWRAYFQIRRKPRVSYETKDPALQSTSWLQMPFSASTILIITSMVVHWVVSHGMTVEESVGSSHILQLSAGTALLTGIIAGLLVFITTVFYLIPMHTWMPLMGGSSRVVFCFACHLSLPLPADGVSFGEISPRTGGSTSLPADRVAAFGSETEPLDPDVDYPAIVGKHDSESNRGKSEPNERVGPSKSFQLMAQEKSCWSRTASLHKVLIFASVLVLLAALLPGGLLFWTIRWQNGLYDQTRGWSRRFMFPGVVL